MPKEMADTWICSACRSINAKRTSSCYRCRAPRELIGATADTLATVGGTFQAAALHPYRPSHIRAALVVIAGLLAFAATTLLALWNFEDTIAGPQAAAVRAAFPDELPVFVAWVIALVLAMAAWAAWISRVVDNQPALGLGYPRVTPRWAVVEALIPGPNLLTGVARIREVLVKLDPKGHGVGFINLAWLLAFGPWALYVLYARFARFAVGPGEVARELRLVLPLMWLGALAGVLLVALAVVRVELLSAARHRDQLGGSTG